MLRLGKEIPALGQQTGILDGERQDGYGQHQNHGQNKAAKQLNLYDPDTQAVYSGEVVMELLFEYESFSFWAGQKGKTSRVEMNDDGFIDGIDYLPFVDDVNLSSYDGQYLLDGDFNGDAYVDAVDYGSVFDYNSNQGVYTQRPY
jgi:hypothetical protein